MITLTRFAYFLLWVISAVILWSCTPIDASKDEALIIHRFFDGRLGSSIYPVFHESVSKEELLKWVQIPLDKKQLVRSVVIEPQKLDFFLTSEALKNWTRQIRRYESFEWEGTDSVDFNTIKNDEIPRYIREGGLPKPKEESTIVGVLYMSKPFVYKDKALLYVRRSGSIGVLWFFKKVNEIWERVTYVSLSAG